MYGRRLASRLGYLIREFFKLEENPFKLEEKTSVTRRGSLGIPVVPNSGIQAYYFSIATGTKGDVLSLCTRDGGDPARSCFF